MRALRERLADWVDADGAAYELGVVIGVIPKEFGGTPGTDPWHGTKGIFWSANLLGDTLYRMLNQLSDAGVLENDDNQRYRWNESYQLEKL